MSRLLTPCPNDTFECIMAMNFTDLDNINMKMQHLAVGRARLLTLYLTAGICPK